MGYSSNNITNSNKCKHYPNTNTNNYPSTNNYNYTNCSSFGNINVKLSPIIMHVYNLL